MGGEAETDMYWSWRGTPLCTTMGAPRPPPNFIVRAKRSAVHEWCGYLEHILKVPMQNISNSYYITHTHDCPIDFHIRHSVPFHDHEIVPPTISWPVRYASILSHYTHESYVCRAKCRVCGTVKSELGQWIRISIWARAIEA